jgi:hypothetical protein
MHFVDSEYTRSILNIYQSIISISCRISLYMMSKIMSNWDLHIIIAKKVWMH